MVKNKMHDEQENPFRFDEMTAMDVDVKDLLLTTTTTTKKLGRPRKNAASANNNNNNKKKQKPVPLSLSLSMVNNYGNNDDQKDNEYDNDNEHDDLSCSMKSIGDSTETTSFAVSENSLQNDQIHDDDDDLMDCSVDDDDAYSGHHVTAAISVHDDEDLITNYNNNCLPASRCSDAPIRSEIRSSVLQLCNTPIRSGIECSTISTAFGNLTTSNMSIVYYAALLLLLAIYFLC
jgi:hypothetical protein